MFAIDILIYFKMGLCCSTLAIMCIVTGKRFSKLMGILSGRGCPHFYRFFLPVGVLLKDRTSGFKLEFMLDSSVKLNWSPEAEEEPTHCCCTRKGKMNRSGHSCFLVFHSCGHFLCWKLFLKLGQKRHVTKSTTKSTSYSWHIWWQISSLIYIKSLTLLFSSLRFIVQSFSKFLWIIVLVVRLPAVIFKMWFLMFMCPQLVFVLKIFRLTWVVTFKMQDSSLMALSSDLISCNRVELVAIKEIDE